MRAKPGREAGLPGDQFVFEVRMDPRSSEEVRWSGGGSPATGSGRRFATVFERGGAYAVAATSGSVQLQFPVEIAPLEEWMARARSFFGPSLDFSNVRVKASRAVFGPSGTGWTCNSVIRFKRPRSKEDLPAQATLIHELAHVWEHQTGQAQLLKGMVEQIGKMFGRNPYDYGGPNGVRTAARLTDFKKEGQAQIVMEHWKVLTGHTVDSMGVSLLTPGYAEDLRRLVEGAGIGYAPAARRTIARAIDAPVARLVNAMVALVE